MLVESLSREQLRNRAKGWAVATVVSAALFAGGAYGWSKEGEDSLNQQCHNLNGQVLALEADLFRSGTFGSDGGLIVRYLETRNPDDSRIRIWGQFKNEKDRVCTEAQRQYSESSQPYARMATIGGGVLTLLGIRMILDFKRLLGRKLTSTT